MVSDDSMFEFKPPKRPTFSHSKLLDVRAIYDKNTSNFWDFSCAASAWGSVPIVVCMKIFGLGFSDPGYTWLEYVLCFVLIMVCSLCWKREIEKYQFDQRHAKLAEYAAFVKSCKEYEKNLPNLAQEFALKHNAEVEILKNAMDGLVTTKFRIFRKNTSEDGMDTIIETVFFYCPLSEILYLEEEP